MANVSATTMLTPAATWQSPPSVTNNDLPGRTCLAMSPDGKWLACPALYDIGRVHVWETATATCRLTWHTGIRQRVRSLVWMRQERSSPTSLLLGVLSADGLVRLWKNVDIAAAAAAARRTVQDQNEDNHQKDNEEEILQPECGHTLRAGSPFGEWVHALGFEALPIPGSPRFLFAGTSQGNAAVWDASNDFARVDRWQASNRGIDAIQGLAWQLEHGDCSLVVLVASSSEICCWKLLVSDTGTATAMPSQQPPVATFVVGQDHSNNRVKLRCWATSPDGNLLVSGTSHGTLLVWSLSSVLPKHDSAGNHQHLPIAVLRENPEHQQEITVVNWLPPYHPHASEYLLAGAQDGRISLWHVPTQTCCFRFETLAGSSSPIKAIVVQPHPCRIVAALSRNPNFHAWDLPLVQLHPPTAWFEILRQQGLMGVWQHVKTTITTMNSRTYNTAVTATTTTSGG